MYIDCLSLKFTLKATLLQPNCLSIVGYERVIDIQLKLTKRIKRDTFVSYLRLLAVISLDNVDYTLRKKRWTKREVNLLFN